MKKRLARPSSKPNRKASATKSLPVVTKAPTGIPGFDDVTYGGLPRGRPSLVCGAAGCGKTLFGLQFLIRGTLDYGENGVFVAFEEREADLVQNVASLGFDLQELVDEKRIALDHVHVEPAQIEENGEYDLEGLFIRLEYALDSVKAKRLVIDTLETIFGGLKDYSILRSELRRLFTWLKDRGITTIITAERGEGALTRHGLEEYVSDCVIVLDHRVHDQVSTRRLRVAKYRGSTHGTNEYPFLIDEHGLAVIPITSSLLDHQISNERVSTGIAKLDEMLGGKGYYRGSSILVSGTAGSGKSSLCAHVAHATCLAKKRALYISYEESPEQVVRNMGSIGLPLARYVEQGLLKLVAMRPTAHGLEGHLSHIHKLVTEFEPEVVVMDPIGALGGFGAELDTHLMIVRLIDFLKGRGVTTMVSNLTHGGAALDSTDSAISSLVDTWLLVVSLESNGERNRGLYVLKSRGMAHSNQIREFVITARGIDLVEPYIGAEGVLTGAARISQDERERAARKARDAESEKARRLLARKREVMEQRIAALRAEFEAEALEAGHIADDARDVESALDSARVRMSERRGSSKATEKNETQLPTKRRHAVNGAHA
ncbi:MAG: circadian clock protein KaiC [Polyangiaceae bacterium]